MQKITYVTDHEKAIVTTATVEFEDDIDVYDLAEVLVGLFQMLGWHKDTIKEIIRTGDEE